MNKARVWVNQNATFIIICLSLLLIGLFVSNNRKQIIDEAVSKHVEITNAIYKVSNTCIRDYYSDALTEEGRIFSFTLPPDDCEATFLKDHVQIMTGYETEQEAHQMAKDLLNEVINSGGNATFFKSSFLVNSETGEIIEDHTQMILDDKDSILTPDPLPEFKEVPVPEFKEVPVVPELEKPVTTTARVYAV